MEIPKYMEEKDKAKEYIKDLNEWQDKMYSPGEYLGGKFLKTPANQKVHSIDITPAMRQSVMKEGQPIAKKDEKKKPFAAPQGPQVASNISPTLSEKMKQSLA